MGNLYTVSEWKGVIVDGIEAVGVHKGVTQNCIVITVRVIGTCCSCGTEPELLQVYTEVYACV